MAGGLPVVEGITETARDAQPMHLRLMEVLAQRPGAGRNHIAEALSSLEAAVRVEGDEDVRRRLIAGIAALRGTTLDEDRE